MDPLSNQKQLDYLSLPPREATEKLFPYVKAGYCLCAEALKKVFQLPPKEREMILLEYFKHNIMSDKSELELFKLPSEARKILLPAYLEKYSLWSEAELELFNLPMEERKTLLPAYVKKHSLYDASEVKLFNLPEDERKECLYPYLRKYFDSLCEEAQEMFDRLPEEERKAILSEAEE